MPALPLLVDAEREGTDADAIGVSRGYSPRSRSAILLIGRRLVGDEYLPAWVVRLCYRCYRVVCLQYPLPILEGDRVLCLTCVVAIVPRPRDRTAGRLRAAVELPPWTEDDAAARAGGADDDDDVPIRE